MTKMNQKPLKIFLQANLKEKSKEDRYQRQ